MRARLTAPHQTSTWRSVVRRVAAKAAAAAWCAAADSGATAPAAAGGGSCHRAKRRAKVATLPRRAKVGSRGGPWGASGRTQ